jgi:GNAT superfamily N-acetyltransferase
MIIRQAVSADVPAIKAIVEEAYAEYVLRIGRRPGPMDDDYDARVDAGSVHVAEDGDGIAGLMVFLRLDQKGLLDNVAVAKRARGTGLGRSLIAYAESLARQAGLPEIILYTHVKMTENLRIYPHLGYHETHRITEKGFDRVYFAKSLSSGCKPLSAN